MLFSEIYGNYYHTVAHILREAVQGRLDRKSLNRMVQAEAFGESMMTIPDALLSGRWGLITPDCRTPILEEPKRPMTILEKRWLKALLLDPRIRLFLPDMAKPEEESLLGQISKELEGIEPLFRPEWLVYYDRYTDGDPFTDPQYIRNFRYVLAALKEKRKLDLIFTGGKGKVHHTAASVQYLEYSEKDDRFRLIGKGYRPLIVNISRISECHLLDEASCFVDNTEKTGSAGRSDKMKKSLVLELTDERNAMERFLLNFSHLQKETKRLDEKHYRITLYYDKSDETEMVIRILSFGIWIRVLSPAEFREKLRQRIERQIQLTGRKVEPGSSRRYLIKKENARSPQPATNTKP